MRRPTSRVLKALLCIAPLAAWTHADTSFEMQPESRLWVSGTSTVRSFRCEAKSFDARVESIGSGAAAAVTSGQKVVGNVEVSVPAEQLDCRNGTMNEHMLKALKAKTNPVIAFRLSSYELAQAAGGVTVEMTGTLTLGGADKPITLSAAATDGGEGTLLVKGEHELRMTEFGLKPPTLMLGTLKVHDRVKVGFDVVLKE